MGIYILFRWTCSPSNLLSSSPFEMTFLNYLTTSNLVLAICGPSFAYVAWLVSYRLWLNPVAGFPGSPWAKLTFWYEFYYEWMKPGQYYRRIHQMHAEYGERPMPRIETSHRHILIHEQALLFAFLQRKSTYLTRCSTMKCLFHLTCEGPTPIPDMLGVLASKVGLIFFFSVAVYTFLN